MWGRRVYFPSEEVVLWIVIALKNISPSSGLEPANLLSNGKHSNHQTRRGRHVWYLTWCPESYARNCKHKNVSYIRAWKYCGSVLNILAKSGYGLDDRAIEVRSPADAKDFSSILCVQTGSGAHPVSCPVSTGGPFPGAKFRPGRDADHSPPSSAAVENELELYLLSTQALSWRVVGQLSFNEIYFTYAWGPWGTAQNRWSELLTFA
jgi:hypothetical protein